MARFTKHLNFNVTGQLMLANLVMFVVLEACVHASGSDVLQYFGVDAPRLWPWTPLTAMFTQTGFADMFFNCLWLWFTGILFLQVSTPRRMLVVYLAGGLAGELMFYAGKLCGLCTGMLFGSSGAVLGIMCCAAAMAPHMSVNLLFLGSVEYRWVAVIMTVLSLAAFAMGNPGGGLAHVGGAVAGVILGRWYRSHKFTRKSFIRQNEAMTLDGLLDKVRRSGYDSLSPVEKRRLSDISKKL